MSTSESSGSNDSVVLRFNAEAGKGGCSGNWSGRNIFVMVLGFVLFWPIGLIMLFWILKGRDVKDLPATIKRKWQQFTGKEPDKEATGNTVFNKYQQTQYDRIRELKDEIKSRAARFRDFRNDAKRRADDAEFKEFMKQKPTKDS